MFTMTAEMKVRPEKKREFLQTVRFLRRGARKIKGIHAANFYRDLEDPNRFTVVKEWETNADFRNYLEQEHFMIFIGALEVLCREYVIKYSSHKKIRYLHTEKQAGSYYFPLRRRREKKQEEEDQI